MARGLEEPEHDLQSIVDRAQLRLCERADPPAETRSIECADLLRKNACPPAGDFDLGPKDCRQCIDRGGRHDHSRELLEKIRLDDDGISSSSLLTPLQLPRRSE